MLNTIGKYLKIENPGKTKSGEARWHAIPRAERAALWSMGTALLVDQESTEQARRHIFQIAHVPGVTKASRVTFMGQHFRVVQVSQASRLHGMELQCEAIRG